MIEKPNNEKVVLITGASHGIGLAIAQRFAEQGYKKVIATSRYPENSPRLLLLKAQYPNLSVEKLDVTDSEENIRARVQSFGTIDILINNAGVGVIGSVESVSQSQRQRIINTNINGVVDVTNAVLPGMRAQNSGRIITISSIVGPIPSMRQGFYSGSKAFVEHYTAQLRNDLKRAEYDIIVANVHPGPVGDTNFAAATAVGDRFNGQNNPYPQASADEKNWRTAMKTGQHVSKTVDTVLQVANAENPDFWNATDPIVAANFADTYRDPTGRRFAKGPNFALTTEKLPIGMTFLGKSRPIEITSENRSVPAHSLFLSKI